MTNDTEEIPQAIYYIQVNAAPKQFPEYVEAEELFTTWPMVVSLASLQKSTKNRTSYQSQAGKTVTTMEGTDGVTN